MCEKIRFSRNVDVETGPEEDRVPDPGTGPEFRKKTLTEPERSGSGPALPIVLRLTKNKWKKGNLF